MPDFWNSRASRRRWTTHSTYLGFGKLGDQRALPRYPAAEIADCNGRAERSISRADRLQQEQGIDRFAVRESGIFLGLAGYISSGRRISTTRTRRLRRTILGVGAWWLINSTLGMKFTPQFQMRFIVDNVFNKQPPFPALATTGGNFAPATTAYFCGNSRTRTCRFRWTTSSSSSSVDCKLEAWKGAAGRLSFLRASICLIIARRLESLPQAGVV